MRSQNNNNNNSSNNRNWNSNRIQSNTGNSYRSQSENGYGNSDYDRERNERTGGYDQSDSGRYSNYEGNFGRGNYENTYGDRDNYSRNYNTGSYGNSNSNRDNDDTGRRYANGSGTNNRSWDSQQPGYYGRSDSGQRSNSNYGGTRRMDEKNWAGGDGRNYTSDYDNRDRRNDDADRGFFGRVGDRIRDTWHDMTDRDDTQENMRRFRANAGHNGYGSHTDSSNNHYNNRGNYAPYPEGRSDGSYGRDTRSENDSRGAYGERRNEYGGYGLDREEYNW